MLPSVSIVNPGDQLSDEGDHVALALQARSALGLPLTYSADNLPPGLTIDSTTGMIQGTLAAGAASGSPYSVSVAVSDSVDSQQFSSCGPFRLWAVMVTGQELFYDDSTFNDNVAGVGPNDDNAIALDKQAYFAGSGQATFANVSNYSDGINGIMVDILGSHPNITAADFVFRVGAIPPSTWATTRRARDRGVRDGAGTGGGGSSRVDLARQYHPAGMARSDCHGRQRYRARRALHILLWQPHR